MAGFDDGPGSRRPTVFACGVPDSGCSGVPCKTNNGVRDVRVHPSSEAAFKCKKSYLLSRGYTQVDSRAFAPPDGGPIEVLTKKSRYGAPLRNGKKGTRSMPMAKFGNRGGFMGSY